MMIRNLSILFLLIIGNFSLLGQIQKVEDFIPTGYVLFEQITGDLNKDNQEDCILVVKRVNRDSIVLNRLNELVDRNRRGIIILLKNQSGYQLVAESLTCFSSENEDGGVYIPPELVISVQRGNLLIHYAHGKYGFWRYTFRYQDADFKLIGYDESNGSVIINSTLSINFLTRMKLIRENINENAQRGKEVFREFWSSVDINGLISLTDIKDFDDVDMAY